MTELVLDTEWNPDQRDCLITVKTSADSTLSVINDILDFSKIEAGRLELNPASLNIRDLVEETARRSNSGECVRNPVKCPLWGERYLNVR